MEERSGAGSVLEVCVLSCQSSGRVRTGVGGGEKGLCSAPSILALVTKILFSTLVPASKPCPA